MRVCVRVFIRWVCVHVVSVRVVCNSFKKCPRQKKLRHIKRIPHSRLPRDWDQPASLRSAPSWNTLAGWPALTTISQAALAICPRCPLTWCVRGSMRRGRMTWDVRRDACPRLVRANRASTEAVKFRSRCLYYTRRRSTEYKGLSACTVHLLK
jgi:hypothetical protein